MTVARVSIQSEDFNVSEVIAAMRAQDGMVGAVCSFIGTVRDREPATTALLAGELAAPDSTPVATISAMELEHYPGMTEKAIEAMIDAACVRFNIIQARVIHRVGLLQPGEQIVLVVVTSAHRGESFQACEFLMDYLKTQAPFWKKETRADGAHWVDARSSDDAALSKWGIEASNV